MSLLDKDTLKKEITPFLHCPKHGKCGPETLLFRILEFILYRLKMGSQWRVLSINSYISNNYNYTTAFYHFNPWSELNV